MNKPSEQDPIQTASAETIIGELEAVRSTQIAALTNRCLMLAAENKALHAKISMKDQAAQALEATHNMMREKYEAVVQEQQRIINELRDPLGKRPQAQPGEAPAGEPPAAGPETPAPAQGDAVGPFAEAEGGGVNGQAERDPAEADRTQK